MGLSTNAKLIYGIKLQESKFGKEVIKIRGCHHNINLEDKFCSFCGEKTFKEKEINSLLRLPRYEDDYEEDEEKPKFYIYTHFNEGAKEVVVGIQIGYLSEYTNDFTDKIEEIENKEEVNKEIINFLQKYNIKIEKTELNFGMYLMLSYS